MTVTVFTKPYCPQCEATQRQLTKLGVPFEAIDLTENPFTLEQLQAAGFRQAPVVVTPDNSWTGYRPDLIREVAVRADLVRADSRQSDLGQSDFSQPSHTHAQPSVGRVPVRA